MLVDFILNVKNWGVDLVYIQMEGCRVWGPVAPAKQYNEFSLHVEDGRMLHVVSFVFHTSIYHPGGVVSPSRRQIALFHPRLLKEETAEEGFLQHSQIQSV